MTDVTGLPDTRDRPHRPLHTSINRASSDSVPPPALSARPKDCLSEHVQLTPFFPGLLPAPKSSERTGALGGVRADSPAPLCQGGRSLNHSCQVFCAEFARFRKSNPD